MLNATLTKNNVLIIGDNEQIRFTLKKSFINNYCVDKIYEVSSVSDVSAILSNKKIDVIVIGLNTSNTEHKKPKKGSFNDDVEFIILSPGECNDDILKGFKENSYCTKKIDFSQLSGIINSVLGMAMWSNTGIQFIFNNATTPQMNDCMIAHNKYNLTTREQQILKLITEGCCNIEIAKKLVVSVNTIKVHVASILQKLEVDGRLKAAVKALKEHLV